MKTHHVYESLWRKPLRMGVDQTILFAEVFVTAILCYIIGIVTWASLILVCLTVFVVHPAMMYIHAQDVQMPWMFLENVFYKNYWAAHGKASDRPRKPPLSNIIRQQPGALKRAVARRINSER